MGSTELEIVERIDVGALLKSIGSLQDLERSSRRPVAEVARTVVGGGPWGRQRNDPDGPPPRPA